MSAQKILELIVANLPIIIAVAGGLGLLSFLAAKIRRAVVSARAAANKTPTKVDDVLVDLLDGPVLELADMIERGDIDKAKAAAVHIKALAEKAKAGQSLDLPRKTFLQVRP